LSAEVVAAAEAEIERGLFLHVGWSPFSAVVTENGFEREHVGAVRVVLESDLGILTEWRSCPVAAQLHCLRGGHRERGLCPVIPSDVPIVEGCSLDIVDLAGTRVAEPEVNPVTFSWGSRAFALTALLAFVEGRDKRIKIGVFLVALVTLILPTRRC